MKHFSVLLLRKSGDRHRDRDKKQIRQDKARQDGTRQDEIGQDKTRPACQTGSVA
jgi:hypothetical protein